MDDVTLVHEGSGVVFYLNTETGKVHSMYLRDKKGRQWEANAVRAGWWGMKNYKPLFAVGLKSYKPWYMNKLLGYSEG